METATSPRVDHGTTDQPIPAPMNNGGWPKWFLVALVAMPWLSRPAFAQDDDSVVSEMEQRGQVSTNARQLLHDRKFSELEAQAENFRTNKVRLPSGFWKLYNFYEGLESPSYGSSGSSWDSLFKLLDEWQAAYPKSPTQRTALAATYVKYAWEARGGGYARNVTEEGWRLFRERLAKGQAVIDKAHAESLYDPHLALVQLVAAKGLDWPTEKYERAFDEAVKREPCYQPYYFQRANYLLPRWNGEPGDVERFAGKAIKMSGDCEGKGIYARVAVYLLGYTKDQWFFDEYKLQWPTVRAGFEDLEKRYPHSQWNLNRYCQLACHAEDSKTAAELFKRIGDHWDSSVWQNEGQYWKWKNWAENPTARHDEPQRDALPRWKRLLHDLLSW